MAVDFYGLVNELESIKIVFRLAQKNTTLQAETKIT